MRPEEKFAQVVSTKTGSIFSVVQMKRMASTPKPRSSPLAGSLMVVGGDGMKPILNFFSLMMRSITPPGLCAMTVLAASGSSAAAPRPASPSRRPIFTSSVIPHSLSDDQCTTRRKNSAVRGDAGAAKIFPGASSSTISPRSIIITRSAT